MTATIDTRPVLLQLQTAQKHSFASASPSNSRTGLARRHIDRQLIPQISSKGRSRLVRRGAKSSKDEANMHDSSDVDPFSASSGHQGVGRKQFLTALSGKHTSPSASTPTSSTGQALCLCAVPRSNTDVPCSAGSILAPLLSLRLPGRADAAPSLSVPEPVPGQVGPHSS